MKNRLPFVAAGLCCFILFGGCFKDSGSNVCELIRNIKIYGAKTSYYVGDPVNLNTTKVPNGYFSWRKANGPYDISNTNEVSISYCEKSDEGWYYLSVSNSDCTTHYDSVYISVINKPATAPCTPANNTVTFSSIPSISFTAATWGMDGTWNCKNLHGYQSFGYPDINIYFYYYWNTREPEDGEYSIASGIAFPEGLTYSVFLATTYSSVYFQPTGGKVYVSHVNGKIQVSFCSVPFSGDLGGPAFTTTATGKLTAP